MTNRKVNWSDGSAIAAAIDGCSTKSDVLRKLGITCTMGNYITLERWCKRHGIDISHFNPGNQRVKQRIRTLNNRGELWTIETACVEDSECTRSVVRRLILQSGILEYKCKRCGMNPEWNGEPLTLQLEHINGRRHDHRIENLCFLCPNCHTQTDTYAGRNKVTATPLPPKRDKQPSPVIERIRSLLDAVPDEAFIGWGAKKRVAELIGVPQGKLMFYIKGYAPEYEQRFTK